MTLRTIYLLRHCSTKDNELGINGSRTDTSLSETGLHCATSLITTLSSQVFGLIFVSPLKRTIQTIQPYLESLKTKPPLIIESLITERELGLLTNSKSSEGKVAASITESGKSKVEWIPPGGESIRNVYERAELFLKRIKDRNENDMLICSHQIFLRSIELILSNKSLNDENFYSSSSSLMKLGEIRKYRVS